MTIGVFDIVFVLVLVSFSLLGYLHGALKEILALLGLAGGFLVATRYADPLAMQINPLLQDENAARLLAFVLLLVLGYLVGAFLAGFSDTFRRAPASPLGQLGGGIVGFGKGLMVALALLWVVRVHIPAFQKEMTDSVIGSWLGRLLAYLERINLI